MPFVSIVVPTRNEEEFIDKCLESLINQNFPKDKYEILVIDGESEDRTVEIASRFPVKIITERKLAPAHNAGIRNSNGEIVAFFDSNANADPNWLRFLIENFDDSKVGCVIGGQECLFGDNLVSRIRKAYHARGDLLSSKTFIREPHPTTWKAVTTFASAFSRNVLIEIGGADESIDCIDKELGILIEKLKYMIIKDRRAKVYHNLDDSLIAYLKKIERYNKVDGILFRRYGVYKEKVPLAAVTFNYIILLISLLLSTIVFNLSSDYLIITLLPLLGGLIYYFGKGAQLKLLNKENFTTYIAFPFLSLVFIFLRNIGFIRGIISRNIQRDCPFRSR